MNNINTVLPRLSGYPRFSASVDHIFLKSMPATSHLIFFFLNKIIHFLSDIKNIMQKLITLLICYIDTFFLFFLILLLLLLFWCFSFKICTSLIKIFISFLINFGIHIPAQLSVSSPPQSKAKFKIGIKDTNSRRNYYKVFIMNRLHLHSQLARQYIVQLNLDESPKTAQVTSFCFLTLDDSSIQL